MTKFSFAVVITAIIGMLMLAVAATTFYDVNSFKIESWAAILAIISAVLYHANKKNDINVNVIIPEDSIKISVHLDVNAVNAVNSSAIVGRSTEDKITVNKNSIPMWKSVNVGEVSLSGEKL